MKQQLSQYEKRIQRRGWSLIAASLVVALGMEIVGILLAPQLSEALIEAAKGARSFCSIIPLLFIPVLLLARRNYVAKLNGMDVAQSQKQLMEHRDRAETVYAESLRELRRIRRLTDGYAVLLSLFGLCVGLCSGILYNMNTVVPWCFFSAYLILCGLTQIRFPVPKELFSEDNSYLNPEKYPELFALARKAADAAGCKGEIKIGIHGEFNGGIGRIGDVYSIRLGVPLLNMLSKEELYSVLLHEFGHMAAEYVEADKEKTYLNWVGEERTPHELYCFVQPHYLYMDTTYSWHMFLFEYACSMMCETAADAAMTEHGDVRYAASALLKMKYYDLFDWEDGGEDFVPFYAEQDAPRHVYQDQIRRFREAMDKRAEDWNALAEAEIVSRSASHPTLKMRMAALGVTEYAIAESDDSAAYVEECRRVRELVEQRAYERGQESYKANRIEAYMQPLARVAAWEEAGKPLIATEYGDLVGDLQSVGRVRDAEALCTRAIDELDTAAACHAYYSRGMIRLRRWDPAGLDDLYFAAANNSNYIEDAMEAIGQFCCLTGRQAELDTYRERAVQVGQHQKDVTSEMNVLRRKDRLVPEQQLPEELLTGLLETVRGADDGTVAAVYLVRKTITEDFFCTAVVVRFYGAPDEKRREILHKVFCYLDTCSDWQFTLFDYDEVKRVKVERIPNSCIYEKERNNT